MKMILIAMLALPLLIGVSCKKKSLLPDTFDTISPDSETQIINRNIDGINFQFFLLNKDNKPTTVFNEGESFEFYFTFQNNTGDSIFVSPNLVNELLFNVYQENGNEIIDLGVSWTGSWCQFSNQIIGFPLKNKEIGKLMVGWKNDLGDFYKYYPLCADYEKELLPKGNYYTIIKSDFEYNDKGKRKSMEIHFKIHFKIQ